MENYSRLNSLFSGALRFTWRQLQKMFHTNCSISSSTSWNRIWRSNESQFFNIIYYNILLIQYNQPIRISVKYIQLRWISRRVIWMFHNMFYIVWGIPCKMKRNGKGWGKRISELLGEKRVYPEFFNPCKQFVISLQTDCYFIGNIF